MEQGNVKTQIAAAARRPEYWLVALLLWILASAARSLGTPWANAAETEALRWGGGIALALTSGWLLRRTELAGQFLVTLTGVMSLFGVLGGDTSAGTGLVGPYHDHQLYGSVLLLLLPFCAALTLSATTAPWRFGSLAALAAGTLCLLLSQTRSAWIGLAAAALVFGWLWLSRRAHRPQRLVRAAVPAALLLLGAAAVWLLSGSAEQAAAVTHRAGTLAALGQDGSWQERLQLWRGTAHLAAAHPLTGIGLGRYPGQQWFWTHLGTPLSSAARPSLSSEAHSFYGQTTAEIGITGLALYLFALAAFAALGLRRLRERTAHGLSGKAALLIAALSALAGQSVDALASPSWQFPEASIFFWAVLGLGLASLRRSDAQAVPAPLPRPLLRAGQWAAAGTLAVVLTAQVLPLGLLTPVEAYTHPATNTFKSVALTQQGTCAVGSPCAFIMLAQYTNGLVDVTFDLGKSGYSATFTCKRLSGNPCSSTFGAGSTASRNKFTVSSNDTGTTLQITGQFEDDAVSTANVTTATFPVTPIIQVTP